MADFDSSDSARGLELLRSAGGGDQQAMADDDAHRKAAGLGLEEAKARIVEAEKRAEFAEKRAATLAALRKENAASEEAVKQAQAEAGARASRACGARPPRRGERAQAGLGRAHGRGPRSACAKPGRASSARHFVDFLTTFQVLQL